jgi:hypothetical protein
VDTPEKNFSLVGSSAQRRLDSAEWEAYLTDPFLPSSRSLDPMISIPILRSIFARIQELVPVLTIASTATLPNEP